MVVSQSFVLLFYVPLAELIELVIMIIKALGRILTILDTAHLSRSNGSQFLQIRRTFPNKTLPYLSDFL